MLLFFYWKWMYWAFGVDGWYLMLPEGIKTDFKFTFKLCWIRREICLRLSFLTFGSSVHGAATVLSLCWTDKRKKNRGKGRNGREGEEWMVPAIKSKSPSSCTASDAHKWLTIMKHDGTCNANVVQDAATLFILQYMILLTLMPFSILLYLSILFAITTFFHFVGQREDFYVLQN